MTNYQIIQKPKLPDTAKLSVSKILHGDDEIGLPFVCALSTSRKLRDAFCTGILIAPNVVVSASHCLAYRKNPFVLFIQPGTSDVVSRSFKVVESYVPEVRIDDVSKIELGVSGLLDTCILFLDSDVPSNISEPCPLEINTPNSGEAIVAGFGLSEIVYEVAKEIAAQPEASGLSEEAIMNLAQQRVFDRAPSLVKKRSANMEFTKDTTTGLVAIVPNARRQSQYRGDSGGPVFIKDPSGQVRLLATTSYGAEGGTNICVYDDYVNVGFSCPIQSNLLFIDNAFRAQRVPSNKYYSTDRSLTYDQIVDTSMEASPFSTTKQEFIDASKAVDTSDYNLRKPKNLQTINAEGSDRKKSILPYILIPASVFAIGFVMYAALKDSDQQ